MKNIINISILALLMIVASCKKDDNNSSTSSINSTIQQGKWKVTSFIDSGNDETNHYSNYEFQFNSDGTVTAIKTGSIVNGTWSNGSDDSQQKLYLTFSTTPFDHVPFTVLPVFIAVTFSSELN